MPVAPSANGSTRENERENEIVVESNAGADNGYDIENRVESPPPPASKSSGSRLLQPLWTYLWGLSKRTRIPKKIKKFLTFYRLHLLYFIVVDLIGTLIIWLSPKGPLGQISFIDAFFNATSAVCVTGLVTVRMKTFSIFDQVVLLVLMILGSQVFTSLLPVLIRRYYFHLYLERYEKMDVSIIEQGSDPGSTGVEAMPSIREDSGADAYQEAEPADQQEQADARGHHAHTWGGETAEEAGQRLRIALKLLKSEFRHTLKKSQSSRQTHSEEAFGSEEETGTETETDVMVEPRKKRTQEYRALVALSWLVPMYLLAWLLVTFLVLRVSFVGYHVQKRLLKSNDVSLSFFSAFTAVSAFANAGFGLLDDNLIRFQKDSLLLITCGVLILIGNTMYAPSMRAIVWLLRRCARTPRTRSTFQYLLDHPRKCFTHLFPYSQTMWLVATVVILNAVELFFFCLLDWTSSALEGLSGASVRLSIRMFFRGAWKARLWDRFPLARLCPLVMYLVGAWALKRIWRRKALSSIPPRLSTQAEPEVYDDHDVGLFDILDQPDTSFLKQGRALLARDSAYLFIAIFVICCIQHSNLKDNNDPSFNLFAVMFETISAYGNVGLSLGYTCNPVPPATTCDSPPYSFSAHVSGFF
eukprot:jgi/Mesen1/6781/ME000348S06055